MKNSEFSIFCHLENNVNTIVFEPKIFLISVLTKTYQNIKTINAGNLTNTNDGITKTFLYSGLTFKVGDSQYSKAPNSIGVIQEKEFNYNWKFVEKEPNSNKYYLKMNTSEFEDSEWKTYGDYYLNFEKVYSQLAGFENEYNFYPIISDKANALEFEVEYYPTCSNNTYLIFCRLFKEKPNTKLYIKKSGNTAILWSFIENGSIWGFCGTN